MKIPETNFMDIGIKRKEERKRSSFLWRLI